MIIIFSNFSNGQKTLLKRFFSKLDYFYTSYGQNRKNKNQKIKKSKKSLIKKNSLILRFFFFSQKCKNNVCVPIEHTANHFMWFLCVVHIIYNF
ncbi:hypothetical protein BpHYR1_036543 [Brachionus plicatilis]|uniref:Uncharacterized protein n=1 Tax=Brachionus plicatilis TaxID=10195 RepID=A0A3M7RX52_BRAPC|nr:hypothetical protein BpHYR1_036543 [Brachionus plicatilis]